MAVAGAGNPSLPSAVAAGVFAGHQAQIGHQLLGGAEALEVSDLRGQYYGRDQVHAAQRLQRAGLKAPRSTARPVR